MREFEIAYYTSALRRWIKRLSCWDHRSICCKLSIHRLEPITTSYYKTSCCVSRLCVAKLLFYFAGFSQQKFKDVVFEMFCVKQPFGESRPHSACKWMKIFSDKLARKQCFASDVCSEMLQTSTFKWAYTVSPRQEAARLIFECGLYTERNLWFKNDFKHISDILMMSISLKTDF